jgi:aspartyl-tRNA(Asn)/glutamyl-tRNA(Gln) amidotransferase subunit C
MTALTSADILKIAQLARLKIDEKDIPRYAHDISNILALAEQMKCDTAHIEPMAHPLSVQQRLRADVITESDQRELFQSIAPQVEAGLYLVPQVIE